ncbi:MAG TPA: hypothetical protein VLF63_01045 [Patescibacteria group bacterium]|nr:hypothetical protein [Patescibacteria group bacterium]
MKPSSIKKISEAGTEYNEADFNLRAARDSAFKAISKNASQLFDKYQEDGLSSDALRQIGNELGIRVRTLLDGLWEFDSPRISTESIQEDVEYRIIRAPRFPVLRIMKETVSPKGSYELKDISGQWELRNAEGINPISTGDVYTHAFLYDDIDTLLGLYKVLGLEIKDANN